ncbi:MAG: DUF3313 family protein [Pseudomonadota bacterium]
MALLRQIVASRLLVAVCLGAMLGGCTRTVVEAYDRPSSTVVDQAYIKQGADFSQYRRLITDGLEIYYPDEGTPPAQEDLDRIRRIFREAFIEALDGKYQIADQPAYDVLKVNAQIVDMKIVGHDREYAPGGRLRDLVARGELTFLMEISDSTTGEVLARAGDRSRDVTVYDDTAQWDEVEVAARYWAGLFRDWLDRTLRP